MSDKLISAVQQKIQQVKSKYSNLDKRSNPRPPSDFVWILKDMGFGTHIKINQKPAKNTYRVEDVTYKRTELTNIDRLARLFCLLEDLEDWIAKTEVGAKKHQEEMERQAATKIVRMKTFADFNYCVKND